MEQLRKNDTRLGYILCVHVSFCTTWILSVSLTIYILLSTSMDVNYIYTYIHIYDTYHEKKLEKKHKNYLSSYNI